MFTLGCAYGILLVPLPGFPLAFCAIWNSASRCRDRGRHIQQTASVGLQHTHYNRTVLVSAVHSFCQLSSQFSLFRSTPVENLFCLAGKTGFANQTFNGPNALLFTSGIQDKNKFPGVTPPDPPQQKGKGVQEVRKEEDRKWGWGLALRS